MGDIVIPLTPRKHKCCSIEGTPTTDTNIALPDISSCVVMTTRRRRQKRQLKPPKHSAKYFPEISHPMVKKEKEKFRLDRPFSSASAEEYSSLKYRQRFVQDTPNSSVQNTTETSSENNVAVSVKLPKIGKS